MPSPDQSGVGDAAFAIGARYEQTLTPSARRLGAHYTPAATAAGLVSRAFELTGRGRLRCCDPACGGGVFLVAVANALFRRGHDPGEVIDLLVGVDTDAGAVAAATEALSRWAADRGVRDVVPNVSVGDAFDLEASGFDLVIGNPPFGGQLGSKTARSESDRQRLRSRFGDAASGYVDTAVLFALQARRLARGGGVVCMILPRSTLSASHAAAAREALVADCDLVAAWLPGGRVFAADVEVWAPFLRVSDNSSPVRIYGGESALDDLGLGSAILDGDWGGLLSARDGVPPCNGWSISGEVGDLATTTAGFRDEYYAVLEHTVETCPVGRAGRAVTSGLIDPGRCWWGDRPARFGKRSWATPWVDIDLLMSAHPRIGRWVERQLQPKVLVATQSPVVEAVADPSGDLIGVTPVISVVPIGVPGSANSADPSLLAAVLSSPPIAAWAARRRAGTGMSRSALRLSARDCAAAPLPCDRSAMIAAAKLLDAGDIDAFSDVSTQAYGLEPRELAAWWLDRLPHRD